MDDYLCPNCGHSDTVPGRCPNCGEMMEALKVDDKGRTIKAKTPIDEEDDLAPLEEEEDDFDEDPNN